MAAVTLPPVRVRLRLEENVALSEEIWNPLGAVTVILAVRAVPLMVKDWEAEALPKVVVKFPRLAGEAAMVGAETELTVPESATVWFPTPELVSVRLPLTEPAGAVEERRV